MLGDTLRLPMPKHSWLGNWTDVDILKTGGLNLSGNLLRSNRQFYDLLEIFKIGGYCPDTNYLFLGERTSSAACRLRRVDTVH